LPKQWEEAGADGLVLINTLLGMKIDLKTGKPLLANVTGGLAPGHSSDCSSDGLPMRTGSQYSYYRRGGIQNCDDVVEFFNAGADAVEVGAQNFVDPYLQDID